MKEIIDDILSIDSEITPKKLHVKLTLVLKKEALKPIEERDKRFDFNKIILPTLVKVNSSINQLIKC